MPLSPPFRPTQIQRQSPPATNGPLPTLPFEIHRRIIHFRLAGAASYPSPLSERAEASWDDWSGVRGRVAGLKRVEERRDVTRTARGLMAVCKAWKPVVMRYLYSAPYLTGNLSSFSRSILAGDAKWSDINIHQFSLPGRYVSFLDLSTIASSTHPTEVRRAVIAILGLLPNVTHLKLPPGELPFPMEEIGWAPFAKKLECLEGVEVDANHSDTGDDALVRLLRKLPNLEVLSVVGPLGQLPTLEPIPAILDTGRPLRLAKLHTLRLEDVKAGNLMTALLEAELPSLTRLAMTSYFGTPGDLTFALQQMHGSTVRSLTYLQGKPALGLAAGLVPAADTLSVHARLEHLAFLVPDYEQLEILLASAPPDHPLRWLTIFKWVEACRPTTPTSTVDATSSSSGGPSTDTSSFLRLVMGRHPVNLRRINVDGFRWVKPQLGRVAMDAGTSGEMRMWAGTMSKANLELGDMDGSLAPTPSATAPGAGYGPIERRRRSSGGTIPWNGMVGMSSSGGGSPKAEREDEEDDGG